MKIFRMLFVAFCAISFATQAKNEHQDAGLKIGLAAGANFTSINTDAFNAKIPASLPSLKKNIVSMNGSFDLYSEGEPLYTNINIASIQRKSEQSGIRLEESLVNLDINLCYIPLLWKSRYVFGGLGLGQMTYTASYFSDQPNLNFSTAAAIPTGERNFRLKPLYYLNLKAGFVQSISKKLPFSLGLEAGYRIGLNNREWALYGNSLNNSPSMNASGPFASLSIYVLDHFKK
ncbi:MAG: hypothetical protein JST36_03265 [Bacteroidetes bacterium]|nr:hypothetical protein [Bacteroidota bacterium]